MSIAKTSPATARRDLADLVDKSVLTRTGERRHARYHLTIPLRPVATVTIDQEGNILVAKASGVQFASKRSGLPRKQCSE